MSSKKHNRELVKLAYTYHAATSITDDAIFDFLSGLNCPRALTVWLLYESGEHQQLVDFDINPLDYNDPWEFRDAYTAWSFLSKSSFLKLDVSKKDRAFKKFFEFEELCRQTNSRFRNLSLDPLYNGSNVWLLHATTRKISEILGEFSPDELVDGANWGPGVTTLLKGEHVSAVNKFHLESGITRDLYSLIGDWFPVAYPMWWDHLRSNTEGGFTSQVGNIIVTVPKNSKTDRVIAVEPGINLWFQKGIGLMIRRRLARRGIDLNSQETNQQLARASSIDDSLATVDFSSASDSISKELVRELIPPKWYALLTSCRSSLGRHSGTLVRWEKFSSMGNGYTFELESLIFYAAALAVREYLDIQGTISVFGDDVILPKGCYELFSSFSEFLGFRVNKDKSFSYSYFRESCGAHYYDGVDCKPIFLKERLRSVSSIFKLANGVRWLAHRRNSYYGCDSRLRFTWIRLFRRVPKPIRFRISVGIGDGGFICNLDEATPARAPHGIEGYRSKAFVDTGVTQYFEGAGLLLARLKEQRAQSDRFIHPIRDLTNSHAVIRDRYLEDIEARTSDRVGGNSYTLRGRTRLRLSNTLIRRWYNLGPWL